MKEKLPSVSRCPRNKFANKEKEKAVKRILSPQEDDRGSLNLFWVEMTQKPKSSLRQLTTQGNAVGIMVNSETTSSLHTFICNIIIFIA